ncbi:KTSC domain-containing protein [Chryseobacterium sp. CBSDS_008]|uniref:KTSC domain-containing protein n=1 Tax=Chryseobacterium sp. CBSDS_008 TaxID=3415265 RepID=UPI003CED5947
MKLSEIPEALFFRNIFCMNWIMPSSVVKHFIYFPDTEILRIIYQSGAVYDYFKVPATIIEQFGKVKSKGQFLNKVIKPRFKYTKVE